MKDKLEKLKKDFLDALSKIDSDAALRALEIKFLSRRGELNTLLGALKDLNIEARQEVGALANNLKQELLSKFQAKKASLDVSNGGQESSDPTLPGESFPRGHLNPLSLIQNELEDLFTSLGFMIIDGPELESDYYNFTSLNIPPDHPARDMQDTFYVDKPNKKGEHDLVMRTHTSPQQLRIIEKYGAPVKAFYLGRCFRNEATDARHEHTFYQAEAILIDKNINFGHLKSFLEIVGQRLFGPETKLRMRPKFFPFVEPGNNGEYTCFLCQGEGCRICKQSGWLEIVGAGLVHPEVLRLGGVDPGVYSGLAFGFGLTRLAMLKYGINDVRLFHSGDLRFLEQF